MLSFFSFVLMLVGTVNWFFISAFQYDFIAGFFGTQSSLFSRLIYFIIGMAGFIMLFQIFKNKGTIKLIERKKKPVQTEKIATPVKVVEPEEDFDVGFNENYGFSAQNNENKLNSSKTQAGFKDFDASKYDN